VAANLTRLIHTYGPPASTLTDNAPVFTARLAGRKGGRNAFEKVLVAHKIQQKNGRPGHPQTQGEIERFHQTLKNGSKPRPTT
ncbi:IS481 family transposase, partial [Dermabacter sp. p3-SID358]|nr:IS481 family transposase [Dermabacter sp. p3-SID358]